VERIDGQNDSHNLVNGQPKADVEYEFRIIVQDTGGTPQYVRLLMTQRNDPTEIDFYDYDMACTGTYSTGAICTYRTMLGPAVVHKFYLEAKMANGTPIRYPSTGYITGPTVYLLAGNNLVGIPRDINNANLDGQQAFGSPDVYRWDSTQQYFTKVTVSEPVKVGEGYIIDPLNATLIELGSYGDVPGLEYTYPLNPGMNLISNPFGGNVRLSDVKIQKGNQTPVPWQEAVTREWVIDAIYYYIGEDWGDIYTHITANDDAKLVPWVGYWVYLKSTDDIYYLVIPRP
jgi:hypothetical protein